MTTLVLVTIALAIASQLVPDRLAALAHHRFAKLGPAAQVMVLAGALTTIDVLGPDGVAPFIYFQF